MMALGAAFAVSALPIGLRCDTAVAGGLSPEMHAALGEFLDANCRYHQTYRALPTAPMSVTPPALRERWMAANVELRRAVEEVMKVPGISAEDVRMKVAVYGVFFMKEAPPEAYGAQAEALRWHSVIEREAAAFGVSRPFVNAEIA